MCNRFLFIELMDLQGIINERPSNDISQNLLGLQEPQLLVLHYTSTWTTGFPYI